MLGGPNARNHLARRRILTAASKFGKEFKVAKNIGGDFD